MFNGFAIATTSLIHLWAENAHDNFCNSEWEKNTRMVTGIWIVQAVPCLVTVEQQQQQRVDEDDIRRIRNNSNSNRSTKCEARLTKEKTYLLGHPGKAGIIVDKTHTMLLTCVCVCVYHLPNGDSNHHRNKQVYYSHTPETTFHSLPAAKITNVKHLFSTIRTITKNLAQNKQRPNKITNTKTKRNETKI